MFTIAIQTKPNKFNPLTNGEINFRVFNVVDSGNIFRIRYLSSGSDIIFFFFKRHIEKIFSTETKRLDGSDQSFIGNRLRFGCLLFEYFPEKSFFFSLIFSTVDDYIRYVYRDVCRILFGKPSSNQNV